MISLVRAASALGLLSAAVVYAVPTVAVADTTCDPLNPGLSADSCANQPPQTWPVAQGNFTSPDAPGWIYFKPWFLPPGFTGPKADAMRSELYGCGIGPDGTVGCDRVPGRWPDGTPVQAGVPGPPGSYSCGGRDCPLPPEGTNQTVASPQQPAEYVTSDALTFTREVDVLPEGYRLVNGDAWCAVGYQGTVSCSTGENGFTLSSMYGLLDSPS